jgi:predicted secreted protein
MKWEGTTDLCHEADIAQLTYRSSLPATQIETSHILILQTHNPLLNLIYHIPASNSIHFSSRIPCNYPLHTSPIDDEVGARNVV